MNRTQDWWTVLEIGIMELMELGIIILATLITITLAKKGSHAKAREQSNDLPKSEKDVTLSEHQRKQQEIDELITVVLPTINNDK